MTHDKREMSHDNVPHPEFSEESADHERTDASAWNIVKVGIGLIILLVATDFVLRGFTESLLRNDPIAEEPVSGDPHAPIAPPPRLQRSAGVDMATTRNDENARLSTYGWVDSKGKIVRVPIDAAMKMVAENGLPRWPKVTEKESIPKLEQVPPNDGASRAQEPKP